ncbi:MAG: PKD domain-containing protein, partial [Bacteroidota bacterium]
MVRQSLFLTLYLSLVFACEYEQLHRLVPINFDVAVNCYWATFTPSTNIEGDYLWDFGDGNTSSERTPTHVYALAGQYEVSLRIVNEQGAGEIKKNLTINQPYSDNTFQTDDEFLGSYANFFDENITGGYDVLVTNFSSKLTSVYHFSDQGAFENIVAEGEKTRDYVAYFGSSSFNFELINNLEEGFADGIGRAALEGVYSFFIGEENKYLCTKKVVFEEEERTIFVLSVYGKDADTQEGFSIQSLFHGGWL